MIIHEEGGGGARTKRMKKQPCLFIKANVPDVGKADRQPWGGQMRDGGLCGVRDRLAVEGEIQIQKQRWKGEPLIRAGAGVFVSGCKYSDSN